MPIKGIFNQKNQKENRISNMHEFEKQILRINALEVHIKNLLKFEKQFRASMYGTDTAEKKENSWIERKIETKKTTLREGHPLENNQKFELYSKRVDELTQRLNKLDQFIQEMISTQNNSHTNPLSMAEERSTEEQLLNAVERLLSEKFAAHAKREEQMREKEQSMIEKQLLNSVEQLLSEKFAAHIKREEQMREKEENMLEERLLNSVEQLLSEKFAAHIKREEQMREKIRVLESQISKLTEHENTPYNDHSIKGTVNQSELEETITIHPAFDETKEDRNQPEEADVKSFYSDIRMRVLALEQHYLLVDEVQALLLKRMDHLIEKWNELTEKKAETEDVTMQQDPIFKTIYIDKFYLDKYEQNNNFDQLGIKELSGALNIGATYGKDVVPKKITEQVKTDIEQMKAVKEEMEKNQNNTDKSADPQYDESSSDANSISPEEDMPYTDIVIEDDPSLGKEPF